MTLRILCLDIEGGHGGSSRSLYYFLKYVDRDRVAPEVWCRRNGPTVQMYLDIGIPVQVEPHLPKKSSLPRLSRNIWVQIRYFIDFFSSHLVRKRLLTTINDRFDVVYFNHEAFYHLAAWLRPKVKAGFVMHNRTLLHDSWFARRQAQLLVAVNSVNIFISERERDNIRYLANWNGGTVIHNVAEILSVRPQPHPKVLIDSRFTVACLSNYSWLRGVDRLMKVAIELRSMGHKDIKFLIAGEYSIPKSIQRKLRNATTLSEYAALCNVADSFVFLGHVTEPERVLAASHALVKPSREDNPWGRDILEALAMGLPVLACGSFDKFVKTGVNGYLYPHDENFNSKEMALDIIRLSIDPSLREMMSKSAVECIRQKCDGRSRANDLMLAWERAYTSHAE